jgi:hypothetical protein
VELLEALDAVRLKEEEGRKDFVKKKRKEKRREGKEVG